MSLQVHRRRSDSARYRLDSAAALMPLLDAAAARCSERPVTASMQHALIPHGEARTVALLLVVLTVLARESACAHSPSL